MNNIQTHYNSPFDDDEGNNFIFDFNVHPNADTPVVYESGDEDD
jgi:hypothetical protein